MQLYHVVLRSRTCGTRPVVIGGAEADALSPRSAESASRAQGVGSATRQEPSVSDADFRFALIASSKTATTPNAA
jgi:hypothetical protein